MPRQIRSQWLVLPWLPSGFVTGGNLGADPATAGSIIGGDVYERITQHAGLLSTADATVLATYGGAITGALEDLQRIMGGGRSRATEGGDSVLPIR